MRQYRTSHPEYVARQLEQRRRYSKVHPEYTAKGLVLLNAWRKDHPNEIREYNKVRMRMLRSTDQGLKQKELNRSRKYNREHHEQRLEKGRKNLPKRYAYNSLLFDWLILQLGNECLFCGTQSDLQIDHELGAYDYRKNEIHKRYKTIHYWLNDYDNGEPLRVLCKVCHTVSHVFRV